MKTRAIISIDFVHRFHMLGKIYKGAPQRLIFIEIKPEVFAVYAPDGKITKYIKCKAVSENKTMICNEDLSGKIKEWTTAAINKIDDKSRWGILPANFIDRGNAMSARASFVDLVQLVLADG